MASHGELAGEEKEGGGGGGEGAQVWGRHGEGEDCSRGAMGAQPSALASYALYVREGKKEKRRERRREGEKKKKL
jgi:hypothetical protein